MRSCLFVFLFLPFFCFAQTEQWDFGTWQGVELSAKINDDLKSELLVQQRWFKNSSEPQSILGQISASFKVNKFFSIQGSYRYTQRYVLSNYRNSHRGMFDLYIKKPKKFWFKTKRWNISTRLRYQSEYDGKGILENTFRSKLGAKYNIKGLPLNPFASAELFVALNERAVYYWDRVEVEPYPKRYRLKLGLNWDISKKHGLDLTYMFQDQIYGSKLSSVIRIKYAYKLK